MPITISEIVAVFSLFLAGGLIGLSIVNYVMFQYMKAKLEHILQDRLMEHTRDTSQMCTELVTNTLNQAKDEDVMETGEMMAEISIICQKLMGFLGRHKDLIFNAGPRIVMALGALTIDDLRQTYILALKLENNMDAVLTNEETTKAAKLDGTYEQLYEESKQLILKLYSQWEK